MEPSGVKDDRIPLWADTDPGHDDAFAILFAAFHPRLKLLGVSTVHGNASLEHTTANAGSVLEAIGRTDIPVHPGAARPFCRKAVFAPNIHGKSGLDGTDLLPEPTTPPITHVNAIMAMRDALLAEPPGTAWVVATGALTNPALLFATFPELVDHIKGLSVMGGAMGNHFTDAQLGVVRNEVTGETIPRSGNVTRFAEFNIYCDPEAAKSIFSNPALAAKTTLIPLDVTHQVFATQRVRDMVLYGQGGKPPSSSSLSSPSPSSSSGDSTNQPSVIRRLFHDLLVFFAHAYADVFNMKEGPPLHDPVAVAVLLHDDDDRRHDLHHTLKFDFRPDAAGNEERWHVEIVTVGDHDGEGDAKGRVGQTVPHELGKGAPGVRIPRSLDVETFWEMLGRCVQEAEAFLASKHVRR